jgi:hypothetical protein
MKKQLIVLSVLVLLVVAFTSPLRLWVASRGSPTKGNIMQLGELTPPKAIISPKPALPTKSIGMAGSAIKSPSYPPLSSTKFMDKAPASMAMSEVPPPPAPTPAPPPAPKPVQLFPPQGGSIQLNSVLELGEDPVLAKEGEASIFAYAQKYGSLGIVAHNTMAGQQFSSAVPGETIRLLNDDGSLAFYTIRETQRYQALQPNSPYSDFINMETGERISSTNLFFKIYNKSNPLVFQTCIEKNGDVNWGRLFVIARPVFAPSGGFHQDE